MRLPGRYDGIARPIVTYSSDPVLHRPCAPVTVFDEALRRLVLDMFASMHAADGVEGTNRRIAAARKYAPEFGIATECGMGRCKTPEVVVDLLQVHAQAGG